MRKRDIEVRAGDSISIGTNIYPWILVPQPTVNVVHVSLAHTPTFLYGSAIGRNSELVAIADRVPAHHSRLLQRRLFDSLPKLLDEIPTATSEKQNTSFVSVGHEAAGDSVLFAAISASSQEQVGSIPMALRVAIGEGPDIPHILSITGLGSELIA